MTNAWRKILDIVRKTGDRCIVVEGDTEDAFVVMPLESYEALISKNLPRLTAHATADKIEPDITSMRDSTPAKLNDDSLDSFAEQSEKELLSSERFYLEPIE